MNLNASYWNQRYLVHDTGWDVGRASEPLTSYLSQCHSKDLRVLIPGAGNGHEANYMLQNNFTPPILLDIAETPLRNFLKKYPAFPARNVLVGDFFDHEGEYDLILEQTFFCALHPSLRLRYAEKMDSLLAPGGKLVGVLFDCVFNRNEPPFGGSKDEYINYFRPYFDIKVMASCYNSIKPREGTELFINLQKP